MSTQLHAKQSLLLAPALGGMRSLWARYSHTLITLVLFVLAWQAAVRLWKIPSYLVPPPTEVFEETGRSWWSILEGGAYTTRSILLGYALSVVVSIPIALAVAYSPFFEKTVYPLLVLSQLVPKIALAPLFVVWFGFGLFPKVLITFLLSFFAIVIAAVLGFKSIDLEVTYLLRSMGMSGWDAFWKIRLPNALPTIFAGLKLAMINATVGGIIAEFIGGDRGLGYLLLVANGDLRTSLSFAAILVITVIGLVLYYLIQVLERLLIPWHVSVQDAVGGSGPL